MTKSEMIPEEWKENIDEILEEQLFNANRYYAENNPQLVQLINDTSKMNPTEFYDELKKRWNWHNDFYENILEPNMDKLLKKKSTELSPNDVQNLIKIYKTICKIDQATLVMSGGIKKHLEYNLKKVATHKPYGEIDKDETFMLLTPPKETFFIKYHIDHIMYIIAQKMYGSDKINEDKIKKIEKYLLEEYHANDKKIFKSRLKQFEQYNNLSIKDLYNNIKECEIDKNYKTKHFYFTMENSERKAFRDILLYDNLEEKHISKSFIGISGFMFRKKILEYLDNEHLLKNNGYIYEFPDSVIEEKLNELLEKRKKYMDKDVTPYKQRGPTCAISCMLMALDYYDKIEKPNNLMEREYYKKYSSSHMDGTPFSAVAYHLAKNGLETTLVHSEENLFKNENDYLPQNLFEDLMDEYNNYVNAAMYKNVKLEKGAEITTKHIKENIQNGNLVILAGQSGQFLHAILVTGYNDDNFIVCDPQSKNKKTLSGEKITKFINTPIGKWCINVNESEDDKIELLKSCDKYYNTAEEFMHEKTELLPNEQSKTVVKEGDCNER